MESKVKTLLETKDYAELVKQTSQWKESEMFNKTLVQVYKNDYGLGDVLLPSKAASRENQENVATILRNLSRVESCREVLSLGKTVEDLLGLLMLDSSSANLKQLCFGTFQNLAASTNNQTPLVSNEKLIIATSSTLLKYDSKLANVQVEAVRLLARLAHNASCKVALFEEKRIMGAILTVLTDLEEEEPGKNDGKIVLDIKRECFKFLWLLAYDASIRNTLFDSEFTRLAVSELFSPIPNSKAKVHALGFLGKITTHVNLHAYSELETLRRGIVIILSECANNNSKQSVENRNLAKLILSKFPSGKTPHAQNQVATTTTTAGSSREESEEWVEVYDSKLDETYFVNSRTGLKKQTNKEESPSSQPKAQMRTLRRKSEAINNVVVKAKKDDATKPPTDSKKLNRKSIKNVVKGFLGFLKEEEDGMDDITEKDFKPHKESNLGIVSVNPSLFVEGEEEKQFD